MVAVAKRRVWLLQGGRGCGGGSGEEEGAAGVRSKRARQRRQGVGCRNGKKDKGAASTRRRRVWQQQQGGGRGSGGNEKEGVAMAVRRRVRQW